ncbi:cadherin-87A [Lepeophtheirus salmonis]|uniref:cadherin-87A n=1 Tax=Lepeophtheirus salmonis TaxID=72036 RepID=UPI001AE66401|nr:cadherin-87A-like [Lepeophtheirus salmonis]
MCSSILTLLILCLISGSCWGLNLPPEFTADMNQHTILENTPIGTVIYTLTGKDPEGKEVEFGLEGTDKLKVDPKTGEVRVLKIIDRERQEGRNEIRLSVVISDGVDGNEIRPNVVRLPITLIILDENDNPPVFQRTPYYDSIPEDTPAGVIVYRTLEATDEDEVGEALEVKCDEQESTDNVCEIFEIRPRRQETDLFVFRGDVFLLKELNYNKKQIYQVPIIAYDGKHLVKSSITFEVIDVQNTPPVISGVLTGVLNEDDPIGTLVLRVQAADGDTGSPRKIVYELLENPFGYFSIEPYTGEIRVDKQLNREETNGVLTLQVRASEIIQGVVSSEDPTTSTTAEITVTIQDVNDEPPKFNKREYSVTIPENVAFGTPLANLDMLIKDSDTGPNSIFKLQLTDSSGKFEIEPKMAQGTTAVSVKVNSKELDYENPNHRHFLLLVVATEVSTDKLLSSTATINVRVNDLNDNIPVFEKDAFTAIMNEDDPIGTVIAKITAKDSDGGDYGTDGIRYSLNGMGAELFNVDDVTGEISIAPCDKNCIDYEKTQFYFLSYSAIDDQGRGKKSVTNIRVSVTDSNDNPPEFEEDEVIISIMEGQTNFEPKLVLEANDEDDSSKLSFKIIGGNENNLFDLNEETGEIKVNGKDGLSLNTLLTNKILLDVEVSDGTFTDSVTVSILIKDINNHSPVFSEKNYTSKVPENAPIESLVETVKASDSDFEKNAEISYRVVSGSYDDFIVDSTSGEIRVSGSLNYDRKSRYILEVIAVDSGYPSALTGTTTVVLDIIDENDKIPYFYPSTQRTHITEDSKVGTILFRLNATDIDAENSSLEYGIIEPITAIDQDGAQVNNSDIFKEFFAVNSKTGEVSVAKKLDRNIASIVSLSVEVIDTSASILQKGTGTLVINIIDVNDFSPRFQSPWSIEEPTIYIDVNEEESNGTEVYTFTADDPDSKIDYFIIRPKNHFFQVEKGSGILKIRNRINYEELDTKNIVFDLYVYDSGIPQKSATANIVVNIININDEEPKFNTSMYSANILENSPPGTPLIQVHAEDLDEGEYGKVSYSLYGRHKDVFSIDPQRGNISVKDSSILDRETLKFFPIQVVVEDSAPVEFRKSSSIPINVTILDVNDHAPIFISKKYEATIVDNIQYHPFPSAIIKVNGIDKDEGKHSELFFEISSGNEDKLFYIDNTTGVLYPNASFSGYNGQSFVLEVQVLDEGGKERIWESPDKAIIEIDVDNVNSHKPEWFPDPPLNEKIEVAEESGETNYVIMKVNARDMDIGDNQRISYFLKVNNKNVEETSEFSMNPNTGELKAKVVFDREKTANYELVLVAKDHGTPVSFEALRFVTVDITDINDNKPTFPSQEPIKFNVPENEEPGYFVGQIAASDPDEGVNGYIYYHVIDGNLGREFNVEKSTGKVYTKMKLDRESISQYTIKIMVTNEPQLSCDIDDCDFKMDGSEWIYESNGKTNKVELKIFVEDKDDNDPSFESEEYNAGVKHNAKVGDSVIDVLAYDLDEDNRKFSYTIRTSDLFPSGSKESAGSLVPFPFDINQNGRISLSSLMAEFNQDKFELDVEAKELSTGRKAKTKVNIWIIESHQLIKLVVNKEPLKANQFKEDIIKELSNITENTVLVSDIRYHVTEDNRLTRDMTDMYLSVVNKNENMIVHPDEIIKIADENYDYLNSYYEEAGIVSILPASQTSHQMEEPFDKNLAALIALILVTFIGIVIFSILCCCSKSWVASSYSNKPMRLQESPQLGYSSHKLSHAGSVIDNTDAGCGNGTDNPLWIDQKYKAYEEQELTMTVFTDQENSVISGNNGQNQNNGNNHSGHDSNLMETQSNAYATINKFPNTLSSRRTNLFNSALDLNSERDYATLEKNISRSPPGPVVPGIHPSAGIFQGSLPRRFSNEFDSSTAPVLPPGNKQIHRSNLTINKEGEPELVAELMD